MNDNNVTLRETPEMYVDKLSGWDLFTPEIAWYIYDFFKFELTPIEKLIFYSYYINDMMLEGIAERMHCSFQNIGIIIKKIEKRLHHKWKNKEDWVKIRRGKEYVSKLRNK